MRHLLISRTSAKFIKKGHPWVLQDRFTVGLDELNHGEAVSLKTDRGEFVASAIVDKSSSVCARVYHKKAGKKFDISFALEKAFEKRSVLNDSDCTNCYRLVNEENDFLPALRIERYSSVLVVEFRSSFWLDYEQEVIACLQDLMPKSELVIKEHFKDLRMQKIKTRILGTGNQDSEVVVKELGCNIASYPYGGLATGVYVDQRATREFLKERVLGKRVLNTFSYTGVFSIHSLCNGAERAVNVDISAPSLEISKKNAVLNNVCNENVHQDVMDFVRKTNDKFDVVIIDPPTATTGDKGWLLRRDYPTLIKNAVNLLDENGIIVCCCNTKGKHSFTVIDEMKKQEKIKKIEKIKLGVDIPVLSGFKEGIPYQLGVGII